MNWRAPMAAAATGVQVGAAIVATRFVIDQTTPGALALMRYSIGFLCLLPAVLMAGRFRFERRDLLPIGLLGAMQFGVLILLMNIGLQYLPAARAALVFALFPFLTMLIGAVFGQERLTAPKAFGVVVTLGGVALALGDTAVKAGGRADEWIGLLAVLASAICGAACTVLYRPWLRKYPTLPVGAFAMLASVGVLAIVAATEGFFSRPPAISPGGWVAIAFIGASSGVGYFLWLWALRHASPTQATVFLGLSPITAALLGVVLLGEPLTTGIIAGGLLVLAGLWIAHLRAPAR